jgi:hypothetical protein
VGAAEAIAAFLAERAEACVNFSTIDRRSHDDHDQSRPWHAELSIPLRSR